MAFLIPTFTLTPYVNFHHSFYAFYIKYKAAQLQISTDLDWLRTRVTTDWSSSELNDEKPLYTFLSSQIASRCGLAMGVNLRNIDDRAVDSGALFRGGSRQYDVLILGHEEYVTRNEYNQLKHFVASGGRMVEMSGNTFWAEVNYTSSTGIETFVAGHGFEFNGAYAWRTNYEPFDAESVGWFGSTFAERADRPRGAVIDGTSGIGLAMKSVFHTNLAFTNYSYLHNEVNYVRNFTDTETIGAFYSYSFVKNGAQHFTMPSRPIDSYVHKYGRGEVVCFCVFGENLIMHDREAQFFLVYAVTHGFGTLPARFVHPSFAILAPPADI